MCECGGGSSSVGEKRRAREEQLGQEAVGRREQACMPVAKHQPSDSADTAAAGSEHKQTCCY